MKKVIFYEFIKLWKEKPKFRRTIKIFVMIGTLGIFVISGFVIWGSISLFNYMASETKRPTDLPLTGETKAQELPVPAVRTCFGQAHSLMALQPWICLLYTSPSPRD